MAGPTGRVWQLSSWRWEGPINDPEQASARQGIWHRPPGGDYPDARMTTFATRDFVPLAESTFAWLLDRGFTLAETSAKTLYASVLFTNETTHVRIALDVHDRSLDVSIGPAAGARAPSGAQLPDGTRAQFPLWLLLWVRTADEARARSLSDYAEESEADLRMALEANSLALKEAAADVLAGDFSIFARAEVADRARIEANIARRAWPSPPP